MVVELAYSKFQDISTGTLGYTKDIVILFWDRMVSETVPKMEKTQDMVNFFIAWSRFLALSAVCEASSSVEKRLTLLRRLS